MTTPTDIEYALMAGASYYDNRLSINRFPVPDGWLEMAHVPNNPNYPMITGASGFEAISFQNIANPKQIVISFAGTDFSQFLNNGSFLGNDFWNGNIPLITGTSVNAADQLVDAVEYYLQVKASVPAGTVITLTGHSLGGGLASLLGAFFGEKAVTFDQAPFASAANVTNAQILKDYLASVSGGGFVSGAVGNNLAVNTALANLDAFINAADTAQILATRVMNISNIYVQGEVLSTAPFGAYNKLVGGTPTQLDQTSITMQPFGLSSVDLHSQALLTAFLQSPSFEAATS